MDKEQRILTAAVLLVLIGGLYCYLMNPDVAGFLYDDGMYLMAAQALADGEGYRLPGIAGQPVFYKYPPLFPALLVPVLWLIPDFPDHIAWLKGLNMLISLAALGLLFYYLRQVRRFDTRIALGLLLVVATNLRFIEISIEIMSEPLFFLLTLGMILSGERARQEGKPLSSRRLAVMILLSVLAFYTRTMGLLLILATALWLWRFEGRRKAGAFGGISALLCTPWFLWSSAKPDQTEVIGDFLIRTFQESYFQSMRMDLRYEGGLPELYARGVGEIAGNFSLQVFPLLERLLLYKETLLSAPLILGVSAVLLLFLGLRAYREVKRGHYSLSGLYVTVYLAVLPLWSFYSAYPRFIIMVLPFMLAILVTQLQAIRSERLKIGMTALLIAGGVFTNAVHLAPYLDKPHRNRLVIYSDADLWQEYQAVFSFLKAHTPKDSVVYTDNGDENYLLALHAERTATDFFVFLPSRFLQVEDLPLEEQEALVSQYVGLRAVVTREVLRRRNVDYVVENRFAIIKNMVNKWAPAEKTIFTTEIMRQLYPRDFTEAAASPGGLIRVYRFHPRDPDPAPQPGVAQP